MHIRTADEIADTDDCTDAVVGKQLQVVDEVVACVHLLRHRSFGDVLEPMCPWRSTIVGMTVLPVRSTRAAPAGTCTSPRRPMAVKWLLSTTNTESSIGALPSPVMRRAPRTR
jgi:hypothetical protein